MANIIVIPARYASERFPGKLLRDDSGWPLIRHVHERCLKVAGVDRVVVAADGERIAATVASYGGEVVITDPQLPSGTDRVAAAADTLALDPDRDLIVNVQGDEPLLDPGHVENLFRLLGADGVEVATLAARSSSAKGFRDRNRVKVVTDVAGAALYFSRAPIPYHRDANLDGAPTTNGTWLYHIGVYGFRPRALSRFAAAEPTPLESLERLEQLRFLEMGVAVHVAVVSAAAAGIDTAEDYELFLEELERSGWSPPASS